mmetsp:Transcript_2460/g.3762  ORF Transcript_2460/g.3762 Transcript_2460/m.3762 type:complete len:114 (+) Transcript_2460:81-422(+)
MYRLRQPLHPQYFTCITKLSKTIVPSTININTTYGDYSHSPLEKIDLSILILLDLHSSVYLHSGASISLLIKSYCTHQRATEELKRSPFDSIFFRTQTSLDSKESKRGITITI